jgi:hypothetical protein
MVLALPQPSTQAILYLSAAAACCVVCVSVVDISPQTYDLSQKAKYQGLITLCYVM